jgi:hypothetical protein
MMQIIPQHSAGFRCVWEQVHEGADAWLAAHWIATPQSDSPDQEDQEGSSDGRCCGTQQHGTRSSGTLQAMERQTGGRKLQHYRNVSDLVDPRPIDGTRFTYRGMPLFPVSYDCDWMVSNKVLLSAVCEEVFVIGCEA